MITFQPSYFFYAQYSRFQLTKAFIFMFQRSRVHMHSMATSKSATDILPSLARSACVICPTLVTKESYPQSYDWHEACCIQSTELSLWSSQPVRTSLVKPLSPFLLQSSPSPTTQSASFRQCFAELVRAHTLFDSCLSLSSSKSACPR